MKVSCWAVPGRATRCCAITVALAATAATRAAAQTSSPIGVTQKNARAAAYLNDLANPRGLMLGVAGGALLQELRSGDRTDLQDELAFRATKRVVGISVRHGLAAAMHRDADTRYQLCECRGFGPRVAHALVETFTDRRATGGRSLAVPRLAAHYAENLTGLVWERDRDVAAVLTGTSLSLGVQALFNIGREITRINLGTYPPETPPTPSNHMVPQVAPASPR